MEDAQPKSAMRRRSGSRLTSEDDYFTASPRRVPSPSSGPSRSPSMVTSPTRPRAGTRRRSSTVLEEPPALDKGGDSDWFDVPLAFALIPAVGSLLTGSDLLKDFMHMAFLLYYLHDLIRVPWSLYISARARRSPSPQISGSNIHDDHIRNLARSELRVAELLFLVFTLIAPLLGAVLLRYISKLLSVDFISSFSTTLYILATGMRPWRHLVQLLRNRTEALHDVVHLPSDEALVTRLTAAETEIAQLREALLSKAKADDSEALELAKREMKRNERQAEIYRTNADARMKALEMALESIQRSQASGPLSNLIFGGADRASTSNPPIRTRIDRDRKIIARAMGSDAEEDLQSEAELGTEEEYMPEPWRPGDDDPIDPEGGVMATVVHSVLLPVRMLRTWPNMVFANAGVKET